MAAPADKTIGDLNGKWFMNKTLSDNPEPALALQGIGFLTRKAIGLASVTLHVKQYTGPHSAPTTQEGECMHIDIDQTATGGIKGTSELRCIDWEYRGHSDWLFGKVKARSKWLSAQDLPAAAVEYGANLGKDWIEEGEGKGPNGETHLFNIAESENGWTAVQVWGFMMVGGERRHARNIVIKKEDKTVELRFIYDYIPQ